MNKIEFYKNRSLGERFSVAAQFIRQNWKALIKIILIPATPLVLVMGYFEHHFMISINTITANITNYQGFKEFYSDMGISFFIYILIVSLFMIVIYALSATVMNRYEEGTINSDVNVPDFWHKVLLNMKKVFLVNVAVALLFIGISAIFVFFIVITPVILKVLFVMIFFMGIFAIFPSISLVFYPAIFQGKTVWRSIIKGVIIGFKNWGTTFVILLIAGIVTGIISTFLQMPSFIFNTFNPGQTGIVPYILALLSSFAYVIVTPLTFIFLAFHYFSIIEKEEGISLKSKIEQFDNL